MKWTPFERFSIDPWIKANHEGRLPPTALWKNSLYTVLVYDANVAEGWPAMTWLSIKRNDRGVMRDWRHLQRIKNEIVGPENEAVELFPAESRLVDEANQFHLWVLNDPALRFPFGHRERQVADTNEAEKNGARQRGLRHGYDLP